MNKTLLIMKHEFLNMVKTKGFIILTLAFPVIALLAIGIYQIVQGATKEPTEPVNIGYIDEIGGFNDYTSQPGDITFSSYGTQEEATGALLADDINEYIIITSDYVATGKIDRYTLKKELEPAEKTRSAMKSFLLSNLLHGQTSSALAERVKYPMWLNNIRLDTTGDIASDQGGFVAFIVPFLFSVLLLMAIFSSSGTLLQGLGEEKENRVMEILLSSVSARQLLTGKVLGLGATGLAQIVIWLLSATFLLRLVSTTIGGIFSEIQVPGDMLVLGIVYFILGYLLFAVLMTAVGAVGASARHSQQLSMLFIMPAILPFYVLFFFMRDNPDHVVSTVFTMIPITAPMTVFVRFALSEIPVWELALSITLLMIAIVGGLILSAKVFRTFVLMYGKSPGLREIVRSLRQA